ncbi:MAG: hypothetical protein DRN81_06845 [Thermoproteota archaeon]|nr:MAG: hypothetical protein DRN81_06845 [Candidatus Korarchaeota archaeon]
MMVILECYVEKKLVEEIDISDKKIKEVIKIAKKQKSRNRFLKVRRTNGFFDTCSVLETN